MSAEDLGKRLLAEVEEVGLDEVLNSLRLHDPATPSYFGLPALDDLIKTAVEAKAATSKTQPTTPIVELISTSPPGGKTSLIYHLTAHAVLPTDLGGRQACAIIIDADGKFSASRLAHQMHRLLEAHAKYPAHGDTKKDAIVTPLKHVHIFRPQSMASLIATINSLQSYLFNANRHHSFDRAVSFIALDSASAFYWQAKSDAEHAALLDKNAPSPKGYVQLAAALKNASRIFNTPIIFTCWNLAPNKKSSSSFEPDSRAIRPSLPPPWQALPTLRLVVKRVPVRKLPVEIGVEEALREGEMRQKVVEQGKFECFVNEWGLDERTMREFHAKGAGFEFRVVRDGVMFENASE